MMRDSKSTDEIMIFLSDVCNFCALCVHLRCASKCGYYSPENEDNPRYPNLAKISKIRRCSSLRSGVIFLFEEKKNEQKLKNEFLVYVSHKNELFSAKKHQNVIKPKYDVNGLYAPLWLTFDDILKNF